MQHAFTSWLTLAKEPATQPANQLRKANARPRGLREAL